jgi:sec-independent protein translocase protein TatA
MPDIGAGEIVLVLLAAFALFGYRRLPDMARSLGRSMRIMKAEVHGLAVDDPRGKAEPAVTRGPLGHPATEASGPLDASATDASGPAADPAAGKTTPPAPSS